VKNVKFRIVPSYYNTKFLKVPELFPNREVRIFRMEQLCSKLCSHTKVFVGICKRCFTWTRSS